MNLTSKNRIVYPPDAAAVIDVTQAPYFLDNTGNKDCTAVLVSILDEIALHSIRGMKKVMDELESVSSPNYKLANSFENAKRDGKIFGVFPYELPPSRIIYFPKGTYLISDTICYSFDNLKNAGRAEISWCIRFQGESREETIIKLKDSCKGFEYGMARPVISFMRGNYSNVAMSNYFRNLTVDIGQGNPGAIGLEFFGNNAGSVRDVTIRSSDPEFSGAIGLSVSRLGATGCLFKNIEIEGFDFGMKFIADEIYLVCEDIFLKNQRNRGIFVEGPILSIHHLRSENTVPALCVRGHNSHVVLLDAELNGGMSEAPSIDLFTGQLFLRNIRSKGYQRALGGPYFMSWGSECLFLEGNNIEEYFTGDSCTLAPGQANRSLNLKIEEAPLIEWDSNFEHWTHPGEFGALGNGESDDTTAIQRAMDSGKSVIYFQPGEYRINASILIPDTVKHVNFMFVNLIAGKDLQEKRNSGMFTIVGDGSKPLLMEDLFSFEKNFGHHVLIDHASTRTLVLRNLHSQSCAFYRNSVSGGTVFIENVVSTPGIHENKYEKPCFIFKGQKVWCRQINPEYSQEKIINDGSQLFIMGFKTEGHGIAITTLNGGQTEAVGGMLCFGGNNEIPMVLNDESDVSLIASTTGTMSFHCFKIAVKEVLNGEVREALHEQFPVRYLKQYFIPLYSGRKSGAV